MTTTAAATTAAATITLGQASYIAALLVQRDLTDTLFGAAVEEGRDEDIVASLSKEQASATIDALLTLPLKADRSADALAAPDGMHRFGGVIFKVQTSPETGRSYAKALLEDGQGGWTFEYTPGAIRNLSPRTLLSLEEAKEFGAVYGTCCVCARTLTNEDSIAAGIGPVCASKF